MTAGIQTTLTEAEVVHYLQQHPDFFHAHLALLEVMHIPNPNGNVVSLIAKQLELFKAKHHELENQLNDLIEIARKNDHSFNRLHQLTLSLLKATTLEQVVIHLEHALAEFFLTDLISIRFIQDQVIDTALASLFVASGDSRLQYFTKELNTAVPFCGEPSEPQAEFLFGNRAATVKSCAIIPMIYPRIKALLAIGHTEKEGFHADMGNIFLMQISEIAATRLISLRPPVLS